MKDIELKNSIPLKTLRKTR